MQNEVNQTNQKDPNDRGKNASTEVFSELCSIWQGRPPLFGTKCLRTTPY